MPVTRFACFAVVAVLTGGPLAGCMTHAVKPKVSQAVLDARARRNATEATACPQMTLSAISPLLVGFPFNEADLTDVVSEPLAQPVRWLTCHSTTPVVIKPDSDGHGTPAEQNALAEKRATQVRDYLVAHGIAAERIRVLARGGAAPAGEHFLIQAEGRRW